MTPENEQLAQWPLGARVTACRRVARILADGRNCPREYYSRADPLGPAESYPDLIAPPSEQPGWRLLSQTKHGPNQPNTVRWWSIPVPEYTGIVVAATLRKSGSLRTVSYDDGWTLIQEGPLVPCLFIATKLGAIRGFTMVHPEECREVGIA